MPLRVRIPIMRGLSFNKTLFGPGRGGHNRGSGANGSGCVVLIIALLFGFWYIGKDSRTGPTEVIKEHVPVVAKPKPSVPIVKKPTPQTGAKSGFNPWGFAAFALGLALVCCCILAFVFRAELAAWSATRRAEAEERRVRMAIELAARPKPVQPKPIKSWTSRVAGVSYLNRDKTSRQQVIYEHCNDGDQLFWKREHKNRFDRNAVALFVKAGRSAHMVGYLETEDAAVVAPHIDAGGDAFVWIRGLMGGTDDKPTIGVRILIELFA